MNVVNLTYTHYRMVTHHYGLQALMATREWLNASWQQEPALIYKRRWRH